MTAEKDEIEALLDELTLHIGEPDCLKETSSGWRRSVIGLLTCLHSAVASLQRDLSCERERNANNVAQADEQIKELRRERDEARRMHAEAYENQVHFERENVALRERAEVAERRLNGILGWCRANLHGEVGKEAVRGIECALRAGSEEP